MSHGEAILRGLGWAPSPATLERYRAKVVADEQRDDPLTEVDYARVTVKRAQSRYRRQREALR